MAPKYTLIEEDEFFRSFVNTSYLEEVSMYMPVHMQLKYVWGVSCHKTCGQSGFIGCMFVYHLHLKGACI